MLFIKNLFINVKIRLKSGDREKMKVQYRTYRNINVSLNQQTDCTAVTFCNVYKCHFKLVAKNFVIEIIE